MHSAGEEALYEEGGDGGGDAVAGVSAIDGVAIFPPSERL